MLRYLLSGGSLSPQEILISAAVLLFALAVAITVHEFAHAFSAYQIGDPTAKLEGRVSLNPLRHLDPLGTLLILSTGFGWGRPTPFDPYNLKNPKRDSAIISFAGPLSNLIVAAIFTIPFHLGNIFANQTVVGVGLILKPIVDLNLVLAIFNLIPIHPLDGFKILGGLLPRDWYYDWVRTERWGIFLLLALLFLPLTGGPIIASILGPILNFLLKIYFFQF